MEDGEENFTTFFVIGKAPSLKGKGKYGTCFLLFSEELATITKQIANQCHNTKVPLIKLKNLVLQEGHTPLYFIEVEEHLQEKEVLRFFKSLSENFLIKHLGSYPL